MKHARLAASLLALAGAAASAQDAEPAALMAQLESRLLAARHVVIEATITAEGAVPARLKGRSDLRAGNRASASYAGEFAGKPADLTLAADGYTLRARGGAREREERVGPESNRALLLGLTRMGLLHNLARLTGAQGPDRAHGGVEQWLTLDSYRPITYAQEGELAGLMSFGFEVVVAGTPSASARLWLDPASGLPRRRQQTVRFAQGEMTVIEDYTRFVVE